MEELKCVREPLLRSVFLSSHYFLAWRLFATFYCFGGILWWGVLYFGSKYVTYLTHWSVILSASYLLSSSSLTTRCILFPHLPTNKLMYQIVESLQHISVPICIGVVIAFYFAYIDEPGAKDHYPLDALTIHDHGVSATLTFIDFMLSANAWNYWNTLWKPLLVATLYTLFSLTMALYYGYNVYDQFEWKAKPKQSVINMCGCYVVLWIVHAILFVLRKAIFKCVAKQNRKIMHETLLSPIDVSVQAGYGSVPHSFARVGVAK